MWDGKILLKDFEVVGMDKFIIFYDVFELDEVLFVIDVEVFFGVDNEVWFENMVRMLEVVKMWGFFKICNYGVFLEVVYILYLIFF